MLIGAINWGLIGAFGFNILLVMFNTSPTLERVIEGVIGLSGLFWLYKLLMTKNNQRVPLWPQIRYHYTNIVCYLT